MVSKNGDPFYFFIIFLMLGLRGGVGLFFSTGSLGVGYKEGCCHFEYHVLYLVDAVLQVFYFVAKYPAKRGVMKSSKRLRKWVQT